MIYVLNPSLAKNTQVRLLGILGFAVLTAIGAQISIPREPVPVTMQVLMVLMAGLTLGPRDAFFSMVTYLSAIAAGLPLAADGVGGLAAFTRPSTGYLYAFPFAAAITGTLAIRDHFVVRWLASMVGVGVIYLIGTAYLKWNLMTTWENAWLWGVQPFIAIDIAKAILAAAMGEAGREWWKRQLKSN